MVTGSEEKRSSWEKVAVTLLRCAIGWHFLYEGVTKLVANQWTAREFLANAGGPFSGFYRWMASSESMMAVVDPLNMYGLTLIGLALFTGIAIRLASVSGIILLMLYYCAYPPFGGASLGYSEGVVYLVNRNVVEALALAVFALVREKGYGLYELIDMFKKGMAVSTESVQVSSRREALKNLSTLPMLGIMGVGAAREIQKVGVDGFSGATRKLTIPSLTDLAGELPKGRIGKFEISRLVLGGNMIGGWAHSRDLIYVPALSMAYNTEKKIFETLMLAEKAGINAINIGFPTNPVLQKYKQVTGGKILVISQVGADRKENDYFKEINQAIDSGADILQIHGNLSDSLVKDKQFEIIARMMDKIRSQGYVAGLGAHAVETLVACQEQGIIPDYYMKTLHHDRYWSAHPLENRVPFEVTGENSPDHNKFHDNMFCLFPEEDVAFVEHTKVPVMAYKILAAGAITPEDGFNWAFQNGADFICVGMFDFQVVHNVNTTIKVLAGINERKREWFA